MSQAPPSPKAKVFIMGALAFIGILVLTSLYRDAIYVATGIIVALLCGLALAGVIGSFWAAIRYCLERTDGEHYPLQARIVVCGCAVFISLVLLCICALLVPLWHKYVTPLLETMF